MSIAGSAILVMSGMLLSVAPASAQGTWVQATTVTAPGNALGNAVLFGVSCSSVGNCSATGSYMDSKGMNQAMTATETSGTWGLASEIIAPANANQFFGPADSLNGVSCSSSGNCTAIGNYADLSENTQAMAATETLGSWAQASEVTAPSNAKTDPSSQLFGVSCSSVGNCSATGSYADSSGNTQAMTVTETLGSWAQASELTAPANAGTNPSAFLRGVSCSSSGNCTAIGNYTDTSGNTQAMAATETLGSWAQASEVTAPSNAKTDPSSQFFGVSCSSVGNCSATGSYADSFGNTQAMTATETLGSWAQASELTAPANAGTNPSAFLRGVSCSSSGNCTAIGNYTDTSGNTQAMAATETLGSWAQASEVTAPSNAKTDPSSQLFGVSCSSVGKCSATGSYVDSSEITQAMATETVLRGDWLVASDGGIFSFGDAQFHGSTGSMTLNEPVVGMASTPSGQGYWLVASDGGIFSFGDAQFHGSTGSMTLNEPVVGMASTPSGQGYWLVASDGGIFSFGDAQFHGSTGSMTLNEPVVGMASTPSGQGYWLVASDGGIFSFGDAQFHGSTGSMTLNEPVVGMASTPSGQGYWLVASDGGIFSFGDAQFHGSTGSMTLNEPVVGMASTPSGQGYWLVASDGGIFSFGDAQFHGSTGSMTLNKPVVGMAAI